MSRAYTPWPGGNCPLGGTERIDILTRDGFQVGHSRADYPIWQHTGGKDDIVGYRIVR